MYVVCLSVSERVRVLVGLALLGELRPDQGEPGRGQKSGGIDFPTEGPASHGVAGVPAQRAVT